MPTLTGIENSSARILPKGTVAFCRTASVGKVAILGRDMATSQDFANWVCGPDLLPEYLYEALRASKGQFDKEKQGTTHKTIYMPVLERFRILVPPLLHQRFIAEILDKADSVRRKRTESITLTDTLLRASFLEMFGDPVANPKRWPVRSLGELCESRQYGTAEKSSDSRRGRAVVRMNNITYAGDIDLTDLKWTDLSPREAQKLDLQDGDVLFNRVNSYELVGKTAAWHNGDDFTFAGYLIRLRLRVDTAVGDYVAAAMNMPSMKRTLRRMAKPSINMANISGSDLDRLFLPVPPLTAQKQYSILRQSVLRLRDKLRADVSLGDDLFKSLASRAFTARLGTAERNADLLRTREF
jgi:type I restriction enzyme S subunit